MNQPKISTVEAFYLICVAVIFDLLNWIPLLNIILGIVSLYGFQMYFRMKKVRSGFSLLTQFIEFIPTLSALPVTTVGVIATIILDRIDAKNPRLSKAINAVSKIKTPEVVPAQTIGEIEAR